MRHSQAVLFTKTGLMKGAHVTKIVNKGEALVNIDAFNVIQLRRDITPLMAHHNRHPGYVTNTRSRSLDAIPFNHRLKFDLEIWHWASNTMESAATTYWYARFGAVSNRPPGSGEAARLVLQDAEQK